ncbi:UDP-N-acetylmuramoylalanyl-D-glutamate--2,6-diaminopimelate ligase (UDP-N-acetylmuramyl-tripeptide synthetase) (Meso-diaminopimelate-adding enzyme) (UDP-MurNAc-tripeptide synthetase) [Candidatus Glomeribacter gigasporarum BEG34]|uniref:UDP-N-acetylmuramoyl-L-alanyl-D-glutamate--2,6-diaminopimelate ligase n=1 Tax=Candidatus Glomeribacter gigasporarum BEG34 TaxID=1070319 RepID=G2J912_9BURK|nr:UDP-N-acetylmuramoylalanyl-D-glutamate--2,6-diaminopimelate ligase (UDP-N-acetylmuramyl-tripeptide synthetase) (Meso-diaminopimelate-adding enzyme) (UDP-MurNAc-tripeptide synthetase) [Candidatus Glomeribacter gigasporarum BEG34]
MNAAHAAQPRCASENGIRARTVQHALAWLSQHVSSAANLHADSRAIQPGDAYLAYAVQGADSRTYIDDAIARGAAAVIWQPSSEHAAPAWTVPNFEASDLPDLAGFIARQWYGVPSRKMRVIGITGTNGKTSCAHWIARALTAAGTPCATSGTLGFGMPDQLTAMGFTTPHAPQMQRNLAQLVQCGARAVALEVSSHALHQRRVNGVIFDTAVFTHLSRDHLDYHGTLEAYETAKAHLFEGPDLQTAVVNRDDPVGQRILARLQTNRAVRKIAYGIGEPGGAPPADTVLRATAPRTTATGSAFMLISDWGRGEVETHLLGTFNIHNLLAVCGALLAADVPFEAALAQLPKLAPISGRMQCVGGRNGAPLAVIDYAHTPGALGAALTALQPVTRARGGALVCVFGCGGDRDPGKRPLMGRIAGRLADRLVLTSDNPRCEPPEAIIDDIVKGISEPARIQRFADRARAILQAIRTAAPEDVVLVAGRGHETMQDINRKKVPFSDHDHVRLALDARITGALTAGPDRLTPGKPLKNALGVQGVQR